MEKDSVLVVVSYTDFKYYCRPLLPRIFDDLTYKKKELLFVSDDNYPGLSNYESGDVICARAREFGIDRAKAKGFDWVFFLDIDAIPDPDILERLLSVNHPFVGGTIACRGDSTQIIGHTYGSFEKLDRYPLSYPVKSGVQDVDGISGALMLVHRSVFTTCDYKGYEGVYTIPMRTTCDDEFYCIKVRNYKHIRPKLNLDARAWHLHTDSFAYRWYGEKKPYKRTRDTLVFGGKTYEHPAE